MLLLRDIWAFVAAVIRHWKVLATGSLISGLLAVYEHALERPISGWLLWLVIGLSLIVAFFLAWRQEYLRGQLTKLPEFNPEDLNDLFRSRTSTHASRLAKIYVGKRYVISGVVSDVISANKMGIPRHGVLTLWTDSKTKIPLFLNFSRKWKGDLSALNKSDQIKCSGRLKEAQKDHTSFDKCEIISVKVSLDPAKQTEEKK